MEEEYFLAVDFIRWNLEHEASEPYKGFPVRSRLKSVPNKAVKCNSYIREEEAQRFPPRYIKSVKSHNGHVLRSSFPGAFSISFCPLADFLCLQVAEALVTECEFRDALKQVNFKKSTWLGWFNLRNVFEDVTHVCTNSD